MSTIKSKRKLPKPAKRKKRQEKVIHECVACKKVFRFKSLLQFHIRQSHFNLIGYVPHSETQDINEVWYEKVRNCNHFVSIKKVSDNNLLIKKVDENANIQPLDKVQAVIDVRDMYVNNSKWSKAFCRVCQKMYYRYQLNRHFSMKHKDILKSCNVCNASFESILQCICHVCPMVQINKVRIQNGLLWNKTVIKGYEKCFEKK